MSEFLSRGKRNHHNKWRRFGLAVLSAGAFAASGCAELPDDKTAKSNTAQSGCKLETANSNIKGNSACIKYNGNTRIIKILTLQNRVFARVEQECAGKLSVTSEILETETTGNVSKLTRPFIEEAACEDGLQQADGGKLNRHIPSEALPNKLPITLDSGNY